MTHLNPTERREMKDEIRTQAHDLEPETDGEPFSERVLVAAERVVLSRYQDATMEQYDAVIRELLEDMNHGGVF